MSKQLKEKYICFHKAMFPLQSWTLESFTASANSCRKKSDLRAKNDAGQKGGPKIVQKKKRRLFFGEY